MAKNIYNMDIDLTLDTIIMGDSDFLTGMLFMLAIFVGLEGLGLATYNRDDIYLKHVEQALEVCENNGGLKRIDGEHGGAHEFHCVNGAMFEYTPPELPTPPAATPAE